MDKITSAIRTGLDILFLGSPERTAFGVLLGIGLWILTSLLYPFLTQSHLSALTQLEAWQYVVLSVMVLHLPTIMRYLFKKPSFDDPTEKALMLIDKVKKQGASKAVVNQMYIELLKQTLEANTKEANTKEAITKETTTKKATPQDQTI